MTSNLRFMAPLAAALVLAACGGGGGEPAAQEPGPLAAVPASAGRSPAGMVGYLQAMVRSDAESAEPVALDGFTAPVDEAGEAIPLGA